MHLYDFFRPRFAAVFFMGLLMMTSATAGLRCQLSLPASAKLGEALPLRFSLHSTKTVWVLNWQTPLEGWFAPFVELEGPAGAVPYQGAMAKRGAPAKEDYQRIRAGHSVQASLDLRAAFALDQPGEYRLRYRGKLLDVIQAPGRPPRDLAALQPQALDCPSLRFVLLPASGAGS